MGGGMAIFHSRETKAEWGIPCNQNTEGELWVGKGYKKNYAGQFSSAEAGAIKVVLKRVRGDRFGRFWVDRQKKIVTMMVGVSEDNTYEQASY
jgi:hypothetical protein